MKILSLFSSLCLAVLFMLLNISAASAFCSRLEQSYEGASRPNLVLRLNDWQAREISRLRRKYGRLDLGDASITCAGTRPENCTFIQDYCAADNPVETNDCPRGTTRDQRGRCVQNVQEDDCPGDSVRDRRGRCVKEDEPPPQANPCSAGRLFSQSLEICHCPEQTPIWTGQRCIRANVNDGASNNQIIQRCTRLQDECEGGLRGACRALRTYCDRG